MHSSVVAQARGSPERAACILLLWQGVWVVQEAWSGPRLVGCQTLSCADCAGCCLVGHGREVPGCGIRRRLELVLACWWAGSGSQTLRLLPTHWQVKPDPGVSACLLSGRPSSWSLAAGPRVPRAHFRSLWGRQFMIQLSMGTQVSGACVKCDSDPARAG